MTEPGRVPDYIVKWAKRTLPDTEITRCDCDRPGKRWAGQHLCSTGSGLSLCFYVDEMTDTCVILAVYETPGSPT